MRAVIHDPSDYPLIEDNGYDAAAMSVTNFAMEVKDITRQPAPYPSKCIKKWRDTSMEFFKNITDEQAEEHVKSYLIIEASVAISLCLRFSSTSTR